MKSLKPPDSAVNTKPAPAACCQCIMVWGRGLEYLQTISDVRASDPGNTIILRGVGSYFPKFEGLDWAAACYPFQQADIGLSDIRGVLSALMGRSMVVTTDAPRAEVEAFLGAATP